MYPTTGEKWCGFKKILKNNKQFNHKLSPMTENESATILIIIYFVNSVAKRFFMKTVTMKMWFDDVIGRVGSWESSSLLNNCHGSCKFTATDDQMKRTLNKNADLFSFEHY